MADATKTNTQWTTILGIVQAVGVAIADFLAHTSLDGGALRQPTFWVGLVIAAAMALKGYLTQGTASVGQEVVTKPAEPPQA